MTVHYEAADGIVTITIDRPETRNAIDLATANALLDAWARFERDHDAKVGVLTGSGGTFCAGADLTKFDLIDRPEGHLGMSRLVVSKPTIAAIEGYAVAGGLELALWCDVRVATEDAVLGCFERRWGVPLIDGGTQRLPRIIGLGRAMDLVLTGRPVGATEAHTIGLVNTVTAPGEALATAQRLAATIAGFPQATVRSDRMAMLEGMNLSLAGGLARERELGLTVLDTAAEGAERFASGEKRHGAGTAEQ
jgi:enoyl-CoA hydratase